MCRNMGRADAVPWIAVRRTENGPGGQAKGTIATSPTEIGAICRKIDGKIYKGNSNDSEATAKAYLDEYRKWLFKAQEATMERMTGEDLRLTLIDIKESASGLGQ